MSKTKISEFSTTPGDNTDINGINIAEGCAPSGINNAIRQMMADLKEWQSGSMDVYVVPAGTAAAPGVQFYGDLDTGIYRAGANQLGIAIGGVSIGYFDSTGWVGGATIDTTNIEVTNIKAKDGTAAMSIADSTGAVTVTTVFTLSTTGNIALGTSQTTGNFTIGGISQTGFITIDPSTKGHTFSVASGSTESGATKTINIGTNGVSLSTTLITIGSVFGTTITLNGTVTAATFNSTTIDTTNIEVTNIKAKDGTASASIADSTGVMTIASSILTTTDINGGTIDGATIATSDITVGAGKTLNVSAGTLTLADDQISGDKIQGGTIGSTTITTLTSTTVNASTVDTTNIEVTNIKAKDGVSALSISDTTGAVDVGSAFTASGVVTFSATTQNIGLGTSQTSGTFTVGGASQTGAITVDQSTKTHTLNVASGATENAATKTVNVATGGVSGSTTTITIGSENGTSTTVNGATSLNASDGSPLFVGNSTASTSGSSYLTFKNKDGPGVYRNVARVSGKTTDNGGNGEMLFETYASGIAYKGLKIDNLSGVSMYDTSGNVKLYWDSSNIRLGINKASPSTTLDVDGTISGTTVDTTNLEVTNIKAKDGTAAIVLTDSTGAVTVSTALTANGGAVFNEAAGNYDFRVESEDNTHMLFVDASTSTVGIGTSTPACTLHINETETSGTDINITRFSTASGGVVNLVCSDLSSSTPLWTLETGTSENLAFKQGTSELMRLTSTGLGIGTSSPTNKLTVDGNANVTGNTTLGDASTDTVTVNGYMGVGGAASGAYNILARGSTTSGSNQYSIGSTAVLSGTTHSAAFLASNSIADSVAVTNASGARILNVTLGTSASITSQHGIRIEDLTSGTNNFGITSLVSSGTNKWNIYASGTAANYFAGNVQFAAGSAAAPALTRFGDDNTGIFFPAADTIAFAEGGAESMRITSAGEVLVGGTADLSSFSGGLSLQRTNQAPNFNLYRNDTSVSSGNVLGSIGFWGNDTTSNTPTTLAFINGTASGDHAAGDNPTDLTFGTTAVGSATVTERMRITSAGNVSIGGTANRATTVGTNALQIFDGTAPVGTLANGVSFYSAAGEANVMDAAGNATLLSPHDSETNEWIFRSKHTPSGKVLRIDVERLLRFVNDHFGLDAVKEFVEE